MEKSQKKILILILTIPVVIISASLIIAGISMKTLPWWSIIGMSALILISPFIFFLAQRAARQVDDARLQKQKKGLLIALSIFIFISAVSLVVLYHVNYPFFWLFLFIQALPPILFICFWYYRLSFPKENKVEEDDNQKEEV